MRGSNQTLELESLCDDCAHGEYTRTLIPTLYEVQAAMLIEEGIKKQSMISVGLCNGNSVEFSVGGRVFRVAVVEID